MKEHGGDLFEPGHFFTGCNYWASHAGTAMWSDWRPEVVEADFKLLAAAGLRVLRVFPLWSDFQPIHLLRDYQSRAREYRFGEEPLPDDPVGQAGVSAVMLERFEEFAALAEKHGLQLIVSLVTGWMSGRVFAPPALEGLNHLSDPVSIQWQERFVKTFVARFKGRRAVAAWDLGNECNCLAEVKTSEAAWNWTAAITQAIKAIDQSRPVISGLHSLTPDGVWRMQDQGEITDILTTHPYPYFTPHCGLDPLNTPRPQMHAAAESLYYRGLGKKPCLVEEIGTLGPMYAGEKIAADFIRTNLFTLWAHGGHGLLWWCANEQSHLKQAPYDWTAMECELGLFRPDGSPKPVLEVMSGFSRFLSEFPLKTLPERLVDGVCLLSNGQDTWGAAFGAFLLARQAGLDLEFSHVSQALPETNFYMLPSLRSDGAISNHRMRELLERVKAGATLYLSLDAPMLLSFSEWSGLSVLTRAKPSGPDTVTMPGGHRLTLQGSSKLALQAEKAEVLATDQEGQPAFTRATYGQGQVFVLNYPVETYLLNIPGAFHAPDALPYWSIYREIKSRLATEKIADVSDRWVGLTEHVVDAKKRILIAINYRPEAVVTELGLASGWKVAAGLYGGAPVNNKLKLHPNDAVVLSVVRA
jgi:hypothetical protein